MPETVRMIGKDLKSLIRAVMRFPSVGSFAGSELVSLQVKNGWAIASTFGVILSKARVPAEGELELVAGDERALEPFIGGCSDTVKVVIEADEKVLKIRGGKRDSTIARCKGTDHQLPKLKDVGGVEQFTVSKEIAQKVGYLAEVAYSDASKPEICAVMLAGDGRAMAVNQKCIASLKLQNNGVGRVAIPLPLAKILTEGDQVYVSPKETMIRSKGPAWYVMPSPVIAQKSFPVDSVTKFEKVGKEPVLTCRGDLLALAIQDCNACLSGISRTEIVITFESGNGLELTAENGGTRFHRTVRAAVSKQATMKVPLEELLHLIPFMQDELQLSVGTKNGETFLSFKDGWAMLPRWMK